MIGSMDKAWMRCYKGTDAFINGVLEFIKFARENANSTTGLYRCPCNSCPNQKTRLNENEMYYHLIRNGKMEDYIVWVHHGEVSNTPSAWDIRQGYLHNKASSSNSVDPTMQLLGDTFPFRDSYDFAPSYDGVNDFNTGVHIDSTAEAVMEHYQSLLAEAQTPIYDGSNENVLSAIINSMQIKISNNMTIRAYNEWLEHTKSVLPEGNKYPGSYKEVKKTLKKLGLGHEVIHACYYGCCLFYKEYSKLQQCPVYDESRWEIEKGKKVPRKVVRYFPLKSRLQRLYMSPHTTKEMRWHGERTVDPEYLRHPADGEAWQHFDMSHPDFASEIKNVRLGLATDGFSPFGPGASPHSTWPVVVLPYNFPPSMCMKKEYNILVLLISGPESPGKCLNMFMRPLIDELKELWDAGVWTWDRHLNQHFWMRAAVIWMISDFPGLGMLGSIQTKGYKACPLCLDDIDSVHSDSKMSYLGARRWLCEDHPYRKNKKFNGKKERRLAPRTLSANEVYEATISHEHQYNVMSLHPEFKHDLSKDKLCWTHESIFWELPYWKETRIRHTLDVMHIEKNVCDNVFGTVLGLGRKTKDDAKACSTLEKMGIRKKLRATKGFGSSSKPMLPPAPYTIPPEYRINVFEWIADVKYPRGYAGSLKNKVNLDDKKFYGLKTHDCHVLLQRLLLVVIRPYLKKSVVNPLVELSRFFQILCTRELKKSDVQKMQQDIVMILCKLELIFPPAFFTIWYISASTF
ncbi:hypothetical protein LguiA_030703 [Lonicera macranthoides]